MAEDPHPVEFLPSHPPRTELEQLTDALNAGHITPELFELAKEKLVRTAPAPPLSIPAAAPPVPEAPPGEYPAGELPPLASLLTEPPLADPPAAIAAVARPAAVVPTPAASVTPSSTAWALQSESAPAIPAPARPPLATPPVASPPASYEALLTKPTRQPPRPEKPAESPPAETSSQPAWLKAALVVIILGVLVLIYREIAGSHPNEQLTSPRQPRAATNKAAPPGAPKAHPLRHRAAKNAVAKTPKTAKSTASPKPVASSKPARPAAVTTAKAKPPIKLVLPVSPSPAQPVGTPPEPMPQPIAAASEAGDSEGATRVRAAMAAYYADMLAPPFAAARHFAPRVERLYIQQNLTPADIDANFARSFFPDNQQAVLQIEPGTLRVSLPVTDGSRVATFVERARIYHPSRRGYQRLRAQVRVRFNADYQIVYLRQERLLESTAE